MSTPEVKQERTGWRDLALNDRHRRWGWNCPAIDLDALFLEYDRGKPIAIVEYKNERAQKQFASHPSYQAMICLGNLASIPVIGCRYASDFSWWSFVALNEPAKHWLPQRREHATEREWVTLLYSMRGYEPPEEIWEALKIEI